MARRISIPGIAGLGAALLSTAGQAHVPFLEEQDYSPDRPYVVHDVANSKSIHAQIGSSGDVDVYRITLNEPLRIFLATNVPYCRQYRQFSVTYALTGPGLPAPAIALPIELPPGHGAVVVRDPIPDPDTRPTWLEPFSGRQMWTGPEYALDDAKPGSYQMIVWNEQGMTGDYIAVIGEAEIFGQAEIRQTIATSPKLKNGADLMVECDPTMAAPARLPFMRSAT